MVYPDPVLDGSLSLVIPVHDEADNIGHVITACRKVLPELSAAWQVLLVDDASSDATLAVARSAMGADEARLRVVHHDRKLGYGVTVADGLRAAGSDYVAFIDGDGQFDVEDLALLADTLGDADLVTGWRRQRADPRYRLLIAGVFNLLVRWLYGVRFHDVDCGLKVMRHSVLEAAMPILARSALLNTELYFKTQRNGFRIRQLAVSHHPRTAGVRSGARLLPILRALRDLVRLRLQLARGWHPVRPSAPVPESS